MAEGNPLLNNSTGTTPAGPGLDTPTTAPRFFDINGDGIVTVAEYNAGQSQVNAGPNSSPSATVDLLNDPIIRNANSGNNDFSSVNDILGQFFDLDPMAGAQEWIEELSVELYLAGYTSKDPFELINSNGTPNGHFIAGMTNFLRDAAILYRNESIDTSTTWQEVLELQAGQDGANVDPGAFGGGGEGSPTFGRLSNTKDLTVRLEAAYQQIVGKAPTAAEKRAFVAAIHGQQKAKNYSEYEARKEAQGSLIVGENLPSAEAAAIQFAEENRPTEVGAKKVANAGEVLRRLVQ